MKAPEVIGQMVGKTLTDLGDLQNVTLAPVHLTLMVGRLKWD